jgi:hypothetical protein
LIGAVLLWFAFPADHPRWAKGNLLVFFFIDGREGLREFHPPVFDLPPDSGYIPISQREINLSSELGPILPFYHSGAGLVFSVREKVTF